MGDGDEIIKEARAWRALVPGLLVSDLDRSVDVYTALFGFTLEYSIPGRLAVVGLEGEQVTLTQYDPADPLVVAELVTPFGRGVTLNVRTPNPKPCYERLRDARYPIAAPMEVAEFDDLGERHQRTSFLVADPDGYLLRFSD